VLSEVLGDERVHDAHDRAVRKALTYTEEHFSEARITCQGVTETVKTKNLVIAAFEHNTSRELDPQLHTHAVVMNMTMRKDG
jgi:conjugative relaxase-like TrwC/TraI family protein